MYAYKVRSCIDRGRFRRRSVFLDGPGIRRASAVRKADRHEFEYKVDVLSYNPGERLTDAQRARQFETLLNREAKAGWEPVTSLLSRSTVQTVGGAIATRDSTSFLAFRRTR